MVQRSLKKKPCFALRMVVSNDCVISGFLVVTPFNHLLHTNHNAFCCKVHWLVAVLRHSVRVSFILLASVLYDLIVECHYLLLL